MLCGLFEIVIEYRQLQHHGKTFSEICAIDSAAASSTSKAALMRDYICGEHSYYGELALFIPMVDFWEWPNSGVCFLDPCHTAISFRFNGFCTGSPLERMLMMMIDSDTSDRKLEIDLSGVSTESLKGVHVSIMFIAAVTSRRTKAFYFPTHKPSIIEIVLLF